MGALQLPGTLGWLLTSTSLLPTALRVLRKAGSAIAPVGHALTRLTMSPNCLVGAVKDNVVPGVCTVCMQVPEGPLFFVCDQCSRSCECAARVFLWEWECACSSVDLGMLAGARACRPRVGDVQTQLGLNAPIFRTKKCLHLLILFTVLLWFFRVMLFECTMGICSAVRRKGRRG